MIFAAIQIDFNGNANNRIRVFLGWILTRFEVLAEVAQIQLSFVILRLFRLYGLPNMANELLQHLVLL